MIRRLFKFFAIFLLSLLLGAITLVAVLLAKPAWLINDRTVNFALHRLLEPEALSWSTLHVKFETTAWLRQRLYIQVKNLVVASPSIDSKIQNGELTLDLDYRPNQRLISAIGPLRLESNFTRYRAAAPDEGTPTDLEPWLNAFDRIRKTTFRDVVFRIRRLEILSGQESTFLGSAEVNATGINENASDMINIKVTNARGMGVRELTSVIQFSQQVPLRNPRASFEGKVKLAGDRQFTFSVKTRAGAELDARASFVSAALKFKTSLHGKFAPGRLDFVSDPSTPTSIDLAATAVRARICNFQFLWGQTIAEQLSLSAGCQGTVRASQLRGSIAENLLPAEIPVTFASKSQLTGAEGEKVLQTKNVVTIAEFDSKGFELAGDASLIGTSALKDFKLSDFVGTVDLRVQIDQFKRVVSSLAKTRYAVPAPFHVLAGTANCALNGRYSWRVDAGTVPMACKVDLRSPLQVYKLTGVGELGLRTSHGALKPKLALDVSIDEVVFDLPEIKLGEPAPQLLRDKRFLLGTDDFERPNTSARFEYDIKVKTARAETIKVRTNLAQDTVPISADLRMRNTAPIEGEILVGAFRVSAMRREAVVEKFSVALATREQDRVISGLIRIPNNDYKVTIQISGTIAKPHYVMESDPPLSQSQMMGVMLFGRVPDAMEAENLRSADEASAAMVSGAVSLASMYYLAATPVESVSYNPSTKFFSAKVNLRPGFSLVVGTGSDSEKSFGITKRLGGGWSVEATNVRDEKSETDRAEAMLRWAKRY